MLRYLYFRTLFFIFIVLQSLWGQTQSVYLKIRGNNLKESNLIDSLSYKQRFNDFISLQKELTDTNKKLQHIGYIESEASKPMKINDSTFLSVIQLKKKFYTIYIYFKKELISSDVFQSMSTQHGDTYFVTPLSNLESVLNRINSDLANNGAPFTTVTLENIQKKDSVNLKANLMVDSRSRRIINNVVIKGYSKFPHSFIKYFLKINLIIKNINGFFFKNCLNLPIIFIMISFLFLLYTY